MRPSDIILIKRRFHLEPLISQKVCKIQINKKKTTFIQSFFHFLIYGRLELGFPLGGRQFDSIFHSSLFSGSLFFEPFHLTHGNLLQEKKETKCEWLIVSDHSISHILKFPSPKDDLCQVWLKLAQLFWRRRIFNFVYIFSLFRN